MKTASPSHVTIYFCAPSDAECLADVIPRAAALVSWKLLQPRVWFEIAMPTEHETAVEFLRNLGVTGGFVVVRVPKSLDAG